MVRRPALHRRRSAPSLLIRRLRSRERSRVRPWAPRRGTMTCGRFGSTLSPNVTPKRNVLPVSAPGTEDRTTRRSPSSPLRPRTPLDSTRRRSNERARVVGFRKLLFKHQLRIQCASRKSAAIVRHRDRVSHNRTPRAGCPATLPPDRILTPTGRARRVLSPRHRVRATGASRVNIPDSWILIGIVTAVPVAGVIAALIAARVPADRADT